MSVYTKLACFVGGTLFGSFGIKLLSSKDAKNAYVLSLIHIWRAYNPVRHQAMQDTNRPIWSRL